MMATQVVVNGIPATLISTNDYQSIYPTETSQVFPNGINPAGFTNNAALLIVNYSAGATWLNFGASATGLVARPDLPGCYMVPVGAHLALGFGDLARFLPNGAQYIAAMTAMRGEVRLSIAQFTAGIPNRDDGFRPDADADVTPPWIKTSL